jgi:folate-binding protein YgfZ
VNGRHGFDWKAGSIVQVMYVPRPLASIIKVTGRDRAQFLQGMITNDVSGSYPAAGLRAFHLDNKGSIVYPMTLHATSDAIYIDIEGAEASDVIASLDHYLVMERCALRDVLETTESFWLLGDIVDVFSTAPHSTDGNLLVFTVGDAQVYTLPVLRRNGPCFVVWSTSTELSTLLDDSGAICGTFEAAEAERLSAAIPAGCIDFSRILAMESGIVGSAISFAKGCYIGQEVVARIDARGRTHRELVLLEIPGSVQELDVKAAESVVGHIRSSIQLTNGHSVAICHLRNEARTETLTVGTVIVSAVRGVV